MSKLLELTTAAEAYARRQSANTWGDARDLAAKASTAAPDLAELLSLCRAYFHDGAWSTSDLAARANRIRELVPNHVGEGDRVVEKPDAEDRQPTTRYTRCPFCGLGWEQEYKR